MIRPLPILLLAVVALPAAATAQERASSRFDDAALAPRLDGAHFATTSPLPFTSMAAPSDAAPGPVRERVGSRSFAAARTADGERSFLAKTLHLVGGAIVGGWVGYVGSQVALSDWEKETNGSFTEQRSAWVAGGMLMGLLGSRLIGGTTAPRSGVDVLRPTRGGRNVITREDILASGAQSVFDLVTTLRREWLITRGTNSFGESPRGSGGGMGPGASIQVTPGQPKVIVYLDQVELGGIETTQDILTNDIMEIEFVEPREAVLRYGSGHTHGVIVLKTAL